MKTLMQYEFVDSLKILIIFLLIKPSFKGQVRAKSYCTGKAGRRFSFNLTRQDSFWSSLEAKGWV